jgi:hypothetical protein
MWLKLLEEFWQLERMLTSDIVKSSGGDVVSLSFSDQCIVLQEISQFSRVEVGLFGQDFLCLAPGEKD